MLDFYELCFMSGLVLIILSFLLGQVFDLFGTDGLGFDGIDLPISLPVNPLLMILFITLMGGFGSLILLFEPSCYTIISLFLSSSISGLICFLLQHFFINSLKRAQNTSAPSCEELIGLDATVHESIPKGGFGEITYIIHGNSYVAPAKATTLEESISTGTAVTICWIEDHIFYVTNIKLT